MERVTRSCRTSYVVGERLSEDTKLGSERTKEGFSKNSRKTGISIASGKSGERDMGRQTRFLSARLTPPTFSGGPILGGRHGGSEGIGWNCARETEGAWDVGVRIGGKSVKR